MNSLSGIPKTPTRPKKHSAGVYTPKCATPSSQRRLRSSRFVKTPRSSPFLDRDMSREDSPESFSDSQDEHSSPIFDIHSSLNSSMNSPATPQTLTGLSLFLPTPSTVGTGRHESPFIRKYYKSRPLIERFQAIADETHTDTSYITNGQLLESLGPELEEKDIRHPFLDQDDTESLSLDSERCDPQLGSQISSQLSSRNFHDVKSKPRTPVLDPAIEQKPQFDSFPDFEESVQIFPMDYLNKLPRFELPNPFIDHESRPRLPETHESVDFSTHMEMINHRTGHRIVEVISSEQSPFKPRKLDFTSAVSNPKTSVFSQTPQMSKTINIDDFKIANKFVESSIGKNFVMGEARSKGLLDFVIFADDE